MLHNVHDLVIDNARIIDGLSAPAREGGVAVTGGRIAAIARDLGEARLRVDAQGLVLAPGIVDIHTHCDAQLTWDPFATVARGPKRRVNDLPTGASRLDAPAVGRHGVWVNCVRAVDPKGVIADCGRPGRVLREFAS